MIKKGGRKKHIYSVLQQIGPIGGVLQQTGPFFRKHHDTTKNPELSSLTFVFLVCLSESPPDLQRFIGPICCKHTVYSKV